jgi:hypothetical protein
MAMSLRRWRVAVRGLLVFAAFIWLFPIFVTVDRHREFCGPTIVWMLPHEPYPPGDPAVPEGEACERAIAPFAITGFAAAVGSGVLFTARRWGRSMPPRPDAS